MKLGLNNTHLEVGKVVQFPGATHGIIVEISTNAQTLYDRYDYAYPLYIEKDIKKSKPGWFLAVMFEDDNIIVYDAEKFNGANFENN